MKQFSPDLGWVRVSGRVAVIVNFGGCSFARYRGLIAFLLAETHACGVGCTLLPLRGSLWHPRFFDLSGRAASVS
jgi:hypothetical protein